MGSPADLASLIAPLQPAPPATEAAVSASQTHFGLEFPADYLHFLRLTNGAQGRLGDSSLQLFPVEQLATLHEGYAVDRNAPGFLIVAADSTGLAYGFETRAPEWSMVSLPFAGLDWELARPVAGSFTEFLAQLSPSQD